jgi:glycerate 2-kinase
MKDRGFFITEDSRVNRMLQRIVSASIASVRPSTLFEQGVHLHGDELNLFGKEINPNQYKGIKCVAIGKSAEAMAYEVEKLLGDRVTGVIATPVEKHFNTKGFQFFKTGHPFPDEESIKAAREIQSFVSSSGKEDLLIFLVSGGGSAAAFLPVDGVTLDEVNETLRFLFDNAIPIDKINLLRRHLSLLGGGKLSALSQEAQKISLIISDVVGDDLSTVASGPTVQHSTIPMEARDFLGEGGMTGKVPQSVLNTLSGLDKTYSVINLENNFVKMIASNNDALLAAEKVGIEEGFKTIILTRFLELSTGDAAGVLASMADLLEADNKQVPALILLGGETTVKISGPGKGGRNQQLALEILYRLGELAAKGRTLNRTMFFSFGTDGKDGNSDAAGAYGSVNVLKKVRGGVDEIEKYISRNDSNSFFKKYGGLITTGPTDTNVMDIMGIIVE